MHSGILTALEERSDVLMKLQAFECPNCKAPIEPLNDARFMFCPYCGTRILIDDIEVYKENSKTERERIRADRDIQKHEMDVKHKEDLIGVILSMVLLIVVFGFIIVAEIFF